MTPRAATGHVRSRYQTVWKLAQPQTTDVEILTTCILLCWFPRLLGYHRPYECEVVFMLLSMLCSMFFRGILNPYLTPSGLSGFGAVYDAACFDGMYDL